MIKKFSMLVAVLLIMAGIISFSYRAVPADLDEADITLTSAAETGATMPLTAAPTTAAETVLSTTAAVTTSPPTTKAPTTIPPTTKAPTTAKPYQPPTLKAKANPGEYMIYLTFDDGPSDLTPKVLDILDKYGVHATFFVVGASDKYMKYVKEAYDRGNAIGLHSESHDYAKIYSSVDNYFEDLDKIGKKVESQIGFVPDIIRFPGGSSNCVSKKYCSGIMTELSAEVTKRGYTYFDWNGACGDATGGKPSAEKLYRNAVSTVGKKCIVMLNHDSSPKQTTVDALPKIIEYYLTQGYTFGTLDSSCYPAHHNIAN